VTAHAQRIRETVEREIALNAPFLSLKRDRALAKQEGSKRADAGTGARSAPGTAAVGLVSNETKGTAPVEKFEIDPAAKRIKRMRNGVQHAARLIDDAAAAGEMPMVRKFITLTYADVDGWSADDINKFRRRLREWAARKGFALRGVWVAELQKRGAVHYHMVIWVPQWVYVPHPDSHGWWTHGKTNLVQAHSPIGYISKYASKSTTDDARAFPKGCRTHGSFGVDPEQRRHIRYWQAPFFVRDALTGRADIRKVRGGYADRITGAYCASPWAVEIRPDGRVFAYRKRETLQ
jgi:hypothetical protein